MPKEQKIKRLAIFASGAGSNAENIMTHFAENPDMKVAIVLSDNEKACVLERARAHEVPTETFSRADFLSTDNVLHLLQKHKIDFIVLAGFLCYVPPNIIDNYTKRIVNIHPSLLPKHGGKGMYGGRVHQAVIEAEDTESGITIHHVNERFDEGEIIFQAQCPVLPADTAEEVEKKVRALEMKHFPTVIERFVMGELQT